MRLCLFVRTQGSPSMRKIRQKVAQLEPRHLFEVFRFGIVGLIAAALHYGIYLLLLPFLSENIAFTIGYGISFCANFVASNFFTFRTKPTVKKGVGFALSHLINYLLQMGFLQLYLWIGVVDTIAPIPTIISAFPINFLLVRYVLRSSRL